MPASRTSEPHAGRVALVTGAARGIGQAIAAGLAGRGTRIVPGDIDEISEASDLIGATGHPSVPVTPDVSDPSSIQAAHDRVTDPLGRIAAIKRKHHPQDLFHHNANIQPA
jgi:NAD(P)-dependent dehydrogenase (short-subunit alcohol dehydrogenase family)